MWASQVVLVVKNRTVNDLTFRHKGQATGSFISLKASIKSGKLMDTAI